MTTVTLSIIMWIVTLAIAKWASEQKDSKIAHLERQLNELADYANYCERMVLESRAKVLKVARDLRQAS